MHISIPITLLTVAPISLAYSEHYARGYDDGQLDALLARRDELLRRIDTKATWRQTVAKVSAASKDGSEVMKVFNKTPQGRHMVSEKTASRFGGVVGAVEGFALPKKGSAGVTPNPGLNAQDRKNGKTLKEYEGVGAKAAMQTAEHSLGNLGASDQSLSRKIGTVQGAGAKLAGDCYDGVCNFINKHAGTHLRRDVYDEFEIEARDILDLEDYGYGSLMERDLEDDDLSIWY